MTLEEFVAQHFGEYSKIGAKHGWLWIGEIDADTLPKVDESLRQWRKEREKKISRYRNELSLLKLGKTTTITKATERSLRKLEDEMSAPFISAGSRIVLDHSTSLVDDANLIVIEGKEAGNVMEFREPPRNAVIPDENYHALAGEIVACNVEDYKNGRKKMIMDDLSFYSDMTLSQPKQIALQRKGRKIPSKVLDAEDMVHRSEYFFRNELYQIICPNIPGKEAIEMAERAVWKEVRDTWRKKAELRKELAEKKHKQEAKHEH